MNIYFVYHIGSYDLKTVIVAETFDKAMEIRGWDIEGEQHLFSVPAVFPKHNFYCVERSFRTNYYWDV